MMLMLLMMMLQLMSRMLLMNMVMKMLWPLLILHAVRLIASTSRQPLHP